MDVMQPLRNAGLPDLVALLKEQQATKHDIVVPATSLRSENGYLVVAQGEVELTEDGVTPVDGRYLPTAVADEGVADKLGIPLSYVRRMRTSRPDLYDANVNGWLHGQGGTSPDTRRFLLRTFRGQNGTGVARALLSDSFRIIDNLDVLMAALDGVKQAGVHAQIEGCDLTERRMNVRIVAPEVQALAPVLLNDYRSPFRDASVEQQRVGNGGWTLDQARNVAAREGMGYAPGEEPVVFAGFQISNSETGGGAFTITPRMVIKVCRNGLLMTVDALRSIHVGGKLDDGIIKWSDDTQAKNLALVTARTRDAVATFLDVEYMKSTISKIEEQAGVALAKPAETIQTVGKKLAYDQGTIDGILDHFMRGGSLTAGGVLNAVTSYAQTVEDAERASELEASGLRALALAAS